MSVETEVLASWNAGAARRAVLEFVERAVAEGVPVEERIAVFDNDGTLWCEKPMPIQGDFIVRRLVEMAQADPGLRARQPWKAAYERDYGWIGGVIDEHYAGDDTNLPVLAAGIFAAFEGVGVEDFEARSDAFLRNERHPTLGRGYLECTYLPMVELLGYLDGERVHELHRVGRRSRLHAADQPGGVWHPARAGDRKLGHTRVHPR